MQKNFSSQSGLTLLELIIATAIVSVISTISFSAYSGYSETTKVSQSVAQIRVLSLLIEDYALDYGEYPRTLNDIRNENIIDPWGDPYVYLNLKVDNNNNNEHSSEHDDDDDNDDEQINIAAARKDGNLVPINSNYDLYSLGKDNKSKPPLRAKDSHDDVIFANDGSYIGLAREF